jgi:hypothetical protein
MKANNLLVTAVALGLIKLQSTDDGIEYISTRLDIYFAVAGGYGRTIDVNDVNDELRLVSYDLFTDSFNEIKELTN